jgi:integrase
MPTLTPTPTRELPRGIFIKDPRSGAFWIRYVDVAGKLHREVGGKTLAEAETALAQRRSEKKKGHLPKPKPEMSGLPRGIYEKVPGSGMYWIRYTGADGKLHRERGGSTIESTEDKLTRRRGEKLDGKIPVIKGAAPVPAQEVITVSKLIDDAIKATSKLASAYDLEHKLEIIRQDFKRRPANSVTQDEIIEWLDEQQESREWKPASWNRYQAAWSTIYRVAVKAKKVTLNPAAGIPKQPEDNSRVRFLTMSEERDLLAKIRELESELHANVVILKLHSGMRTSELKRTIVGDYSDETGMLTVHQRKNKNAPPIRHVPLDPIGIAAYKALAKGKEPGELIYPELFGKDGHTPQDFGWITDAAVAAGVTDFTPHDCRHTAASRWVMAGVNLAEVSKYLGHTSMTMTMRYAHLLPENRDKAIRAMMSYYQKPAKKKAKKGAK